MTYVWTGRNWQFYIGGGGGTYGRVVVWLGPFFFSFGQART